MGKKTKIFYATDVHGSEVTFKKFINAGKIYNADVLILGGDLTGKMVIPIVKQPDGTSQAKWYGNVYTAKTKEELDKIQQLICSGGYYPYCTSKEIVEELSKDEKKLDDLFKQLAIETLSRWVELAEKRLQGTNIKLYMTGGNDDIPEISEVISQSNFVINAEEKVIPLDEMHEMASTGFANPTPWNCPRDIPEEKLAQVINDMAGKIQDMSNAVFNFHVPPFGTPIDLAPALDADLKPKLELGGGFKMASVGSTAVRDALIKHQPLLALHGHIHESRGEVRLGRTLCLNPGSEYGEGVLRGVFIVLSDKKSKIDSYVFTYG